MQQYKEVDVSMTGLFCHFSDRSGDKHQLCSYCKLALFFQTMIIIIDMSFLEDQAPQLWDVCHLNTLQYLTYKCKHQFECLESV